MREFHLEIVTPDGIKFDSSATSLLARCEMGDVEILAGHTDFFASLGIGRVRIKTQDGLRLASSAGGFLSVKGGEVKLVATTFEFAEEIDLERAKAAKEKAENSLLNLDDGKKIELAKAKLARALNRIKVAELI